jgi:hypothetical protein
VLIFRVLMTYEPPQSFIFRAQKYVSQINKDQIIVVWICSKGTPTIESEHPVSETRYAHRFVFIPKEHKHGPQTPTFREMVNKQNKAVMAGIRNYRLAASERLCLRGNYCRN